LAKGREVIDIDDEVFDRALLATTDPDSLHGDAALLAGTAAVGSYTTFSTWMLETQRLTEERQYRRAALNIIVSLVLGVAAAALGRLIGAHL